ncbi:unnamed protein product [Rotaria socialis]|uniref:Uncharacterized protein n=2 Tax=Rotaria socialis TaxID=392032 RepID=A0A818AYS1_9BILA|nr:unnamed protein product [Rotaria socialis]CAF3643823.1 unnamed protein product [Rotaria socialis]CAF4190110.1 unnamed protein product [Rotaria socialis]CAF4557726.1 unnamed protein product [Rotaria socialis]CAF4666814.1 unnamed protein product [Rotaria socialis]
MQAIAIAAICITGVAVITGGVAAATIILAPIVSSPEDKFKTENEYRDPGKVKQDAINKYSGLTGLS